MKLSYLEEIPGEWQRVLVIGKTIERDNQKYHIIGMSSGSELRLYIIEPFQEPKISARKNKPQRHRNRLKEPESCMDSYLHCSEFCLGNTRLNIQGGNAGSLKYSEQDYRTIHLFLDMMRAGWIVPEWLKNEEWDKLQLVTLTVANRKKLPGYTPDMPLTITHRPSPRRHIIEKALLLTVGKRRSFCFKDHVGDEVWCHINRVILIDVWEDAEKEFNDLSSRQSARGNKKITPEQLREIKEHCYGALEQSCQKGMCYIGVEYECSKDYQLQFYAKEYLNAYPESQSGSASVILMRLKPDQKNGTHGLPLKGCVIQTAVSPDTVKIPAELLFYYEKGEAWREYIGGNNS